MTQLASDKKAIGAIIRTARLNTVLPDCKSFSQAMLAKQTSLSSSMLSWIETGKQLPTLKQFKELCEVLDIDPASKAFATKRILANRPKPKCEPRTHLQTVGEMLRYARKSLGITGAQLSNLTGRRLQGNQISCYENSRMYPSVASLEILAPHLGLEPEDIQFIKQGIPQRVITRGERAHAE